MEKLNQLKAKLSKHFSVEKYREAVDQEAAFLIRHKMIKPKDPEKERAFKKEKDLWRSNNL